MAESDTASSLAETLKERFGEGAFQPVALGESAAQTLSGMAARGSCRHFTDAEVAPDVMRTLCAIALSSPTKSDLQQRDIILLTDADLRVRLAVLVANQDWIASAPHIAVFCGNNRRQRQLHEWSGIPFANDHLDAFFNAAVDAGIALSAFVTAAEAIGLGCCPISGVRNRIEDVSKLLNLPQYVFPVAGLAFGYPARSKRLSIRLPLETTVHENRFTETAWPEALNLYNARRQRAGDYDRQRLIDLFGTSESYSWSDDKVRQYSQPERAAFGDYVRSIGFSLT